LLNGNGTAPNLLGLLNVSGILTRARGTDSNLDALLKSVTDLRAGSSFVVANAVCMHPSNFETVRLSKDAQGAYLLGNPRSPEPPQLGRARFVVTTRMPAGTALVGNFRAAARVLVRAEPTIEIQPLVQAPPTNENLVICEERLGLAVPRPTALVKITGLN
jgi:HK97 family phage major capsid protein